MPHQRQQNSKGFTLVSVLALALILGMVASSLVLYNSYEIIRVIHSGLMEDLIDLRLLVGRNFDCFQTVNPRPKECDTPTSNYIPLYRRDGSILVRKPTLDSFTIVGQYFLRASCIDCQDSNCTGSKQVLVEYALGHLVNGDVRFRIDVQTRREISWRDIFYGSPLRCTVPPAS
jgi:hypothetical protein